MPKDMGFPAFVVKIESVNPDTAHNFLRCMIKELISSDDVISEQNVPPFLCLCPQILKKISSLQTAFKDYQKENPYYSYSPVTAPADLPESEQSSCAELAWQLAGEGFCEGRIMKSLLYVLQKLTE